MLQSNISYILNSILEKIFLFKYFNNKILNESIVSLNGFIIILLSILIIYISLLLKKKSNKKISKLKNKYLKSWLNNNCVAIYIILLSLFSLIIILNINKISNFSALLFITLISIYIILINTFIQLINCIFPKSINSNLKIIFITALIFTILLNSGYINLILNFIKSYNITLGKTQLNIYSVFYGIVILIFIIFIALWASKIISSIIMKTPNIDNNFKIIFSNIIKIFIITISMLIFMPIIGIDITALAIFGGVFIASLGLCLKNIVSNYLSGFIILLERSVKINDKITIDNFTGYVTKINSRFIVLKNYENQEALIPNYNIISKTIIKNKNTNNIIKKSINLQITFNSNINKALEILNNLIKNQKLMKNISNPKINIIEFNSNGINIELTFWILEKYIIDINYTNIYTYILREFSKNNIKFK